MKYIIIFTLLICLFSCSNKLIMRSVINGKYNKEQVDSLCIVEKIPINRNLWINIGLVDEETQDSIRQWLYIKEYQNKSVNEIVFILEKEGDSLYIFTKRIIKEKDK